MSRRTAFFKSPLRTLLHRVVNTAQRDPGYANGFLTEQYSATTIRPSHDGSGRAVCVNRPLRYGPLTGAGHPSKSDSLRAK